jgi:iron complex transport system substrate-binding protein
MSNFTQKRRRAETQMSQELNTISGIIVDAGFHIHRKLGPGLFESVYHTVLAHDLARRGLFVESKKYISFEYEGMWFENAFQPDLIVERKVIVELKSVIALGPIHEKQLLTYLRILDLRLGLLINFQTPAFASGIKRVVTRL